MHRRAITREGVPVALKDRQRDVLVAPGGLDDGQAPQYDVTRDGRFLINTVLDEASAPITLIRNWNPEAVP